LSFDTPGWQGAEVRRPLDILAPRRLGQSFRWLLGSALVSNLGDGIGLAAGPLLIASLTPDPFWVAMGATFQWLPPLVLGPFAGVMSDRLDRRAIVVNVNLARAVALAALCTIVATGKATVGLVLGVLLLVGIAEVFADSASSMLVNRDDLAIGNSRLQGAFLTVNQLAGPPLGAALFAAGSAIPFGMQSAAVALGAVLVGRVVLPELVARSTAPGVGAGGCDDGGPTAGARATAVDADAVLSRPTPDPAAGRGIRGVFADLAEGVRWTVRHPAVRTLSLTIFIFNITFGAAWSVLVLYSTQRLGMGAVGYGLLTTISACGGLVGTCAYCWIVRHVSLGNLMRIGLILETLTHLSLALTTTPAVALVIFFVFGAHAFVWGTTSVTIRQRAVPQPLQGRVGGVYGVAVFGGLVLGSGVGGVLARSFSVTAPFWFAFGGSALFVVLIWQQLRYIAHDDESAPESASD